MTLMYVWEYYAIFTMIFLIYVSIVKKSDVSKKISISQIYYLLSKKMFEAKEFFKNVIS